MGLRKRVWGKIFWVLIAVLLTVGAVAGLRRGADEASLTILEGRGMDSRRLQRILPGADERSYFRDSTFFSTIARRVSKNAASDSEMDMALAFQDYVYQSVQHVITYEGTTRPDPDATPRDVLVRGFGVCDRKGWAFVELCRQAGISAHLVFLIDPAIGSFGHHVVAQARVDGKWAIFDPLHNILFYTDRRRRIPANINDIIADPGIVRRYPYYETRSDGVDLSREFGKAVLQVVAFPEASFPVSLAWERATRLLGGASLHVDLKKEIELIAMEVGGIERERLRTLRFRTAQGSVSFLEVLAQGRFFPTPGHEYQLGIWSFPAMLSKRYKESPLKEEHERSHPALDSYREARESQLLGRFDEALELYARIIAASRAVVDEPDGKMAARKESEEDATYFRAATLADAGRIEEAVIALAEYRERYVSGKWSRIAAYRHARLLEQRGSPSKAAKIYRQLNLLPVELSMMDVRDRLEQLRSDSIQTMSPSE